MRLLICGLVAAFGLLAGQTDRDSAILALTSSVLNDLTRNAAAVETPEVHEYAAGIARRLSTECDSGGPVFLHILVNAEPNLSSLPGRHLIVHTGFLARVRSEAALAGALAQVLFQSITYPTGRQNAGWLNSPYLLYESRFPRMAISPLRSQIFAADRLAANCLSTSGYDAFELLEDLRLQSVPGEFHADRIRRLEAQIRQMSRNGPALILTSGFLEMRAHLATFLARLHPPSLRAARP